MNKTYRIVWNKARNCLMVVGENAKSQSKSAGSKKPLVNAVTAALLTLGGSNAVATDIIISTPTTTAQTLGSGQGILVDGVAPNTGSIIVSNTAIYVPNATTASSIINSGTISGGYYGIAAFRSSTLSDGITNSGLISGGSSGGAGISAARSSTFTGGINNTGSISGDYGISANQSALEGGYHQLRLDQW
jgi:hypothetical protein